MNKKITGVSFIFLTLVLLITISMQKHYAMAQTTIEWIALGIFDQNEDGTSDLKFGGEDQGDNLKEISFDNDQDGKYDFGYLDTNNNINLDSIWIDRNDNGKIEIKEIRELGGEFQWATFPSSLKNTVKDNKKGVFQFMDYTDDGIFDAVIVDLDRNGKADLLALGNFDGTPDIKVIAHEGLTLIDSNKDGAYDSGRFNLESGQIKIRFPKSLQKQLIDSDLVDF